MEVEKVRDGLKQVGKRVKELSGNISNEEQTKNAFIMPFFQALGYDIFNPLEFVPEFTADVGIKKVRKLIMQSLLMVNLKFLSNVNQLISN